MKISQDLRQFKDETAVLIVAGSFGADFYRASDGGVEEVEAFTIEETNPEIPEGFVVAESGGSERLKKARRDDFLKEFSKRAAASFGKLVVSETHLFAPSEVKNELVKILPVSLQKNLKVHEGNYRNEHIFKLLEKVGKLD